MNTVEKQILDRVTRTESRIMQLGLSLGVDLRTSARQHVDVVQSATGTAVSIDMMDTPISRIMCELDKCSVSAGEVPVFHKHVHLMTIHYKPKGPHHE